MSEENKAKNDKKNTEKKTSQHLLILVVSSLILIMAIFGVVQTAINAQNKPEIITASTLKKIVNIEELSTYTGIYNGIAEVRDKKDPQKIDFYVAYNTQVKAGIDFNEIEFDIDEESKTVFANIPQVRIIDVIVDSSSLDFIFINNKLNNENAITPALNAAELDVKTELAQNPTMVNLARENLIDVLNSLIKPLIKQYDEDYDLEIN